MAAEGEAEGRFMAHLDLAAGDERRALRLVGVAGAVYLLGFALFYPSVPSVRDSVRYLEQAYAFSLGLTCFDTVNVVDLEVVCARPAQYLPGTAAAMTPFVWAFGWRGGFVVSGVSIVVALFAMTAWLRASGRSPLFALLLLGYPSTLVFGRIAMSDAASLALSTVALWLFFTRRPDAVFRSALVGFIAAVALEFRETNVLVFFTLFAATVLRREPGALALVLGGLVGLVFRPLGTWLVFGDPLFVFAHGPTFALAHVPGNLPLYALSLLVFIPAGIVAAFDYRGERRLELVLSVALFLTVYLFYGYSGAESGLARQLVLGPRYFMPLLPLLVFACAEAYPRWYHALTARLAPASRARAGRLAGTAVALWAYGIIAVAFLVHPAHAAFNASYERVQETIYEKTPVDSVVIYNSLAVRKFVNRLYGGRRFAGRKHVESGGVDLLLERDGTFYVTFMDRSGSEVHAEDARANAAFIEDLRGRARVELLHEGEGGIGETLRVWRVDRHQGPGEGG